MKTRLAFYIIFLLLPFLALAQSQEQYYLYNIIEVPSSIDSKNFDIKVDNGHTIEKLKDANGKKIKFATRAGVLMYFQSIGWEFAGTLTNSAGTHSASVTYTYWIIRKPVSKEEAQKAAEDAIKNEDNNNTNKDFDYFN